MRCGNPWGKSDAWVYAYQVHHGLDQFHGLGVVGEEGPVGRLGQSGEGRQHHLAHLDISRAEQLQQPGRQRVEVRQHLLICDKVGVNIIVG